MAIFICEKCGQVDNSAGSNNYWHVSMNKCLQSDGKEIDRLYQKEYEYFETHYCCADCCDGVVWECGKIYSKQDIGNIDRLHWTKFGKDVLLNPAYRCTNAKEYFNNHTENN